MVITICEYLTTASQILQNPLYDRLKCNDCLGETGHRYVVTSNCGHIICCRFEHLTGDSSTGLPWAIGMLEEIENAVLIVRDGDGHGNVPLGGETSDLVGRYLITGEAPAERFLMTSS